MAVLERKIVHIDADKCNGCGLCVTACHEGAIKMVDGKARLVSDSYCDGLGDCLAPCPTGALTIVTRPAEAYDAEAVAARIAGSGAHAGCPGTAAQTLRQQPAGCDCGGEDNNAAGQRNNADAAVRSGGESEFLPCGCPGSMSKTLRHNNHAAGVDDGANAHNPHQTNDQTAPAQQSELMNWPIQLALIPPAAPYLRHADLLLAADCTVAAAPDLHRTYLRDKPLIIACPKLEENEPQIAKLARIITEAQPASITVLRMEVPCCGGLARVAQEAVARSGMTVPVRVVVVGVDGVEKN
ncbi:MAG: 4Fe-4S binding protein [Planctomycetes bacterium]|nr:4Fe-4S binding protein [Planctomycetota bacterium]